MLVGLALALASALATSVAFLFKQRGAVAAPAVDGRHPLRSSDHRSGSSASRSGPGDDNPVAVSRHRA